MIRGGGSDGFSTSRTLARREWCLGSSFLGPYYYRWLLCKLRTMPYVIGLPCVDVRDLACAEDCPVEEIFLRGRPARQVALRYCGQRPFLHRHTLPGQPAQLGAPGRAGRLGPLNADTSMVAALPPQRQ